MLDLDRASLQKVPILKDQANEELVSENLPEIKMAILAQEQDYYTICDWKSQRMHEEAGVSNTDNKRKPVVRFRASIFSELENINSKAT